MIQSIKILNSLSNSESPTLSQPIGDNKLQLNPISVDADYCKEWNESLNDFVVLTRNGQLVNNCLYRVGGLNFPKLDGQSYFMLLKYVESFYDIDFLKKYNPQKSRKEIESIKKHLDGRWCILDKNGVEKIVFDKFKSVYLVDNSCIYSVNGTYYNIETGYAYCNTSNSIHSSDFIFAETKYDKDESKRSVMKINKKDGTFEVFK